MKLVLRREGEGVKNPGKLADVICERPLMVRTFSDHQLNLCAFIQDDVGSGKEKEADSQVQAREILQERLDLYKIDIEELELNLRRNIILGGVFYFDMLNIPPQPKKVGDWIICQGCH